MTRRKRHAGTKRDRPSKPTTTGGPAAGISEADDAYWLYGAHAVRAALANPMRRRLRLLVTDSGRRDVAASDGVLQAKVVTQTELARHLPPGTAHQGVALLVQPLPPESLDAACHTEPGRTDRVVVLDRVSDPRNVGAILRNAAAFGARAMVLTHRYAPPEGGALAKAASGALETVPIIRVANLVRALDRLAEFDYLRIGLDAGARATLPEADLSGNLALVLGAEGAGLRRLTAQHCDFLARLPTSAGMPSLNVSNAAAIALYLARSRTAEDGH